jgi:hypothetical protein
MKEIPTGDISNAKLAVAKLDLSDAKSYYPSEVENIKRKYKILQQLMRDERYKDAKYLSQEILSDCRLVEFKTQRRALSKKIENSTEEESITPFEGGGDE